MAIQQSLFNLNRLCFYRRSVSSIIDQLKTSFHHIDNASHSLNYIAITLNLLIALHRTEYLFQLLIRHAFTCSIHIIIHNGFDHLLVKTHIGLHFQSKLGNIFASLLQWFDALASLYQPNLPEYCLCLISTDSSWIQTESPH